MAFSLRLPILRFDCDRCFVSAFNALTLRMSMKSVSDSNNSTLKHKRFLSVFQNCVTISNICEPLECYMRMYKYAFLKLSLPVFNKTKYFNLFTLVTLA